MIVFFILSLVFTVGWIAGFVLYWLGLANYDFNAFFQTFLDKHFEPLKNLFMGGYGWMPADGNVFYLTYVGIAVAAFALFLLVFGIIVSIRRKRARYIWYVFVWLFATIAALHLVAEWNKGVDFVIGGTTYTYTYQNFLFFQVVLPDILVNLIYVYVIAVCAVLAYAFMAVTIFVALAHAKRRLAEPKEEPAPAAEEVADVDSPAEAKPAEQLAQDVDEVFVAPVAGEDEAPFADIKHDDYNTMQDFVSEPEEQVAQPEEIVVEEVPNKKEQVTKDDLASILKDVVRDIVRDEIARANAAKAEEERADCDRRGDHSITGATFGGPLVVQYFNGGINGQGGAVPNVVSVPTPAPAPAPAPAPKAEPKKEEPKKVVPAPAKEEPKEEPKAEPAPAGDDEAKTPIIRIPFIDRMVDADKEMQDNYNELKNEILSYGVNSRVSNSGDTFRLHRKTYVKLTIAGKSLKLYFALNPADYADSKMPIGDASQHAVYAEIPLIFKVKSGLSVRRAKDLIRDVVTPDGLVQGEVGSVNWVKELKAELKANKK